MAPRVSLPAIPPDYAGNPFRFWEKRVESVLYPSAPAGFRTRTAILFGLIGYVAVVAIVLLVLNIVQCRRHGKPFWIYRLVKSSGPHSLIVGNLGVLEPATTIFSCSILLAHLQDEYDTVFNHAALDQTATWRVAPWSSVFLQAWLTTWASLQAYILASPDNRYVRYLSARVYNGLFLAILGITSVALITLNILSALRDKESWLHITQLRSVLSSAASSWSGGAPDPTAVDLANVAWSEYYEDFLAGRAYTSRLLVIFSITPFFSLFANLACFALLFLVRTQIVSNYSNFGMGTMDLEGCTEPAPPPPTATSASQAALEPSVTTSSSLKEGLDGLLRAPSTKKDTRRVPSRSKVRSMAAMDEGGIIGERAKSLSQLHRAEVDLIITGLASAATSISFGVLSIWLLCVLSNIRRLPWFAREAALMLSTWAYGLIFAIALTARVYVVWVHMAPRVASSSRRPSTEDEIEGLG